MNQPSHLIEIDSVVLDGVDLRDRRLVRALVERETRRALSHSDQANASVIASREAAIAAEVGRSVDNAIKGGVDRA